ncbi:MAG TPA: hypothetical protein VHM26_17305, partial [Chitinophagaceae bacterium]|nr:hypothetical protein [Chitinophagaceae bacterium]
KKVPQQTFRLCAEIELRPDANPFDTLAMIFFKIQLHLAPLVRFYSLNEMLATGPSGDAGFSPGKIFEGPYKIYKDDEGDANEIPHLSKGFLKDRELEDSVLKEHIRLSDLMRIILDTEGVLTIPDIIFNDIAELNELVNKWSIPVNIGHQAIVDILESNVVTLKNGVPFRPDRNEIKKRYDKLMSDYLEANENKTASDLTFDLGSYKQVDEYASIQEHFPKTYGVSHWGLPEQTTVERKKQAKQLQAYCWLFDQLMANYLAQLSSFKHLLSWKNEKQTWFTKLAKDFFKAGDLFVNYTKVTDADDNMISESWDKVEENIQLAAEQPNSTSFRERRGRFLDHLLGRFAESFYDYIGILREFFPNQITSGEINTTRMNFLEKYPDYSSSRAQAFNYTRTDEIWDTENNSGFERRVQRLLGFTNINRRNLVNLLPIIREEDDNGVKKYHFEWIDKRNNILLLQGGEKFEDKQKAIDEMTIAFTMASKPDAFKIVKDNNDGKFAYELRDKLNKLIAIGRKGTENSAKADLKSLLEQRLPVMSDEGIFLVEHLLLYNDNTTDFLPICVDANCAECSDTDPYSFRVSIVMPAYAPRFLNMEFRRYAEKVMREEMPAHLLPKICWVDNEQLSEFEEAWHAWLEVKAGIRNDANDEVLRRFIKVLTGLKTVYPEGYLQDCSSTLEKQLFMLNKNSLGTLKTS